MVVRTRLKLLLRKDRPPIPTCSNVVHHQDNTDDADNTPAGFPEVPRAAFHRKDPDTEAEAEVEADRNAPYPCYIPPDTVVAVVCHNSSCFSSDGGGHIHVTTPVAYVPGNSIASKDLVVPSFTVCSMVVRE